MLTALGSGVGVAAEGGTLTVTAADETALWSAAQLAIANSYAAGLTSVVVADREWTAGEGAWGDAAEPAGTGTAVLTLG